MRSAASFGVLVGVFLSFPPALALCQNSQVAETERPTILGFSLQANTDRVTIIIDKEPVGNWTLIPSDYPKELSLPVAKVAPTEFCFENGDKTACAEFAPGLEKDLAITLQGVTRVTRIKAVFDKPAARFSDDYKLKHRGTVGVEVPEVYELVNIAIAISEFGIKDQDLVYQSSDYYQAVRKHFDPFRNHPLITQLSNQLSGNRNLYFPLKMNAYSLTFDKGGKIVRSDIYDRTGFAGSYQNEILPFVDVLNDFANRTEFRKFFERHKEVYNKQMAFFEKEADVNQMSAWLKREFPSVPAYDGVKIVFSPLVGFNQSLTTIEADGYREVQPHVNFPYGSNKSLSTSADAIVRSAVLFTEINHGFINPTSSPYEDALIRGLGNRPIWADDSKAAQYYGSPKLLFDEYMNWALVSLYYSDRLGPSDFAIASKGLVENLQNGRGFKKFAEFDAYLLQIYRNRASDATVEALYPDILKWFLSQN